MGGVINLYLRLILFELVSAALTFYFTSGTCAQAHTKRELVSVEMTKKQQRRKHSKSLIRKQAG